MAFMVLGMGVPGAAIGWVGRVNKSKKDGAAQKRLHAKVMAAFYLLAFLGGTGGTLATAMQGYDIWTTVHFKTAVAVLVLLGMNSALAGSKFKLGNDGSGKGMLAGRKLHAYFGTAVIVAFFAHGALGLKMLLE